MKELVFSKVLVANRGEIAVRVIRTLRALGIASVAVYSDADAAALHVRAADEALWIGEAAASGGFLNIDRIVAAAVSCGAEAVHPGYGFLAENARFAQACLDAGLVFIGPPPAAILAMGDKIAAKAVVSAAGVPVVPGAGAAGMPDEKLISGLNERWFPVLIKPSAGGGGKGMRVVSSLAEMPAALESARRTVPAEAAANRDPGARGRARRGDPPRGARVLAAATAPEDHRGGAVAAAQRGAAVRDGRRCRVRGQVRRVRRRGDGRVHRRGGSARRLLLHG